MRRWTEASWEDLAIEARLAVNVEIFETRIFLRAGGQARRRRADAGTSLKRDVKAPWYLTGEKLKGQFWDVLQGQS